MGLMPVRRCPKCGANRHVKAFVPDSPWCISCRQLSETELPQEPSTALLESLLNHQRQTNPGLAEKQSRLIESLRATHGSDAAVVQQLAGIFGEIKPGAMGRAESSSPQAVLEEACPYCRSVGACPHLLAYFDVTFGELVSGFCAEHEDKIEKLISSHFLAAQAKGRGAWQDPAVHELWERWTTEFATEGGLASLDPGLSADLLLEVLEEDLGVEGVDSAETEGGPGTSEVYRTFHVEDPPIIFEQALEAILQRLAAGTR